MSSSILGTLICIRILSTASLGLFYTSFFLIVKLAHEYIVFEPIMCGNIPVVEKVLHLIRCFNFVNVDALNSIEFWLAFVIQTIVA